MSNAFDNPDGTFLVLLNDVLLNDEEQYSLWPGVAIINENGRMRPKTLRDAINS